MLYSSEDRERIETKLWNGEFKNIKIELNKWMDTYDFTLLRCAAHGACVNGDTNLLYLIMLFIHKTMLAPNAEKYNITAELRAIIRDSSSKPGNLETASYKQLVQFRNSYLIIGATKVIKSIIGVITDLEGKDKNCDQIIEELSESPIRDCRLYCCGSVSNPKKFLNDSDERVRKVATIRTTFEKKLESYSDNENELIAFLTSALEYGIIELTDGLVSSYDDKGNYRDDLVCAGFGGRLINTKEGYIYNFDDDIFSTIKDRRILASSIYELLLEGKLSFKAGMEPSSWSRIIPTKKFK